MSLTTAPPAHAPHGQGHADELHALRQWALLLIVLGAGIMIVGFAAVAYSFLATLTTVLLIGILLVVGGSAQLIGAFLARRSWRGFFVAALVGVLHILVGGIMAEHPLRAAVVLTLVLAVALLVGGAARLLYAATHRFHGRGWVVLSGVVTLLLGVMVWREWPEASLWVIGTFAGIDLAFAGWGWVMLGLAVRTAGLPATPETR
jgi:uncharacterized membrane protein HdeD (DUF308 family)